jgi:single-strand DNA-binding protein
MNKAIFTGRLPSDPELRYTTGGIAICTFNLAVDRPKQKDGEKGTDWPTIVAWRHKAEFAAKYLTKGRKILVVATVRTRVTEDSSGKKRKITEFWAEEIEFCDSKPQNSTTGADIYHEDAGDYYPEDGFTPVDTDEDLPF